MADIPKSVPAAAVGAAGVVGSGVTAYGLLTSIVSKLNGDDWISVVALALIAIVMLFGLATVAVAGAVLLYRGASTPPGAVLTNALDPGTTILMTGLALVLSGLVVIAIVVLAN